MKALVYVFAGLASLTIGAASAQDMDACISDVESRLAETGQSGDPAAFCECMWPIVGDNPDLMSEIEENGGLPDEGSASDAMIEAVESCIPA
ncbi:MAG: hypothetical protein AAGC77_02275 [Pseudomonadota bacterium]